jgi:hypothetical protein
VRRGGTAEQRLRLGPDRYLCRCRHPVSHTDPEPDGNASSIAYALRCRDTNSDANSDSNADRNSNGYGHSYRNANGYSEFDAQTDTDGAAIAVSQTSPDSCAKAVTS